MKAPIYSRANSSFSSRVHSALHKRIRVKTSSPLYIFLKSPLMGGHFAVLQESVTDFTSRSYYSPHPLSHRDYEFEGSEGMTSLTVNRNLEPMFRTSLDKTKKTMFPGFLPRCPTRRIPLRLSRGTPF